MSEILRNGTHTVQRFCSYMGFKFPYNSCTYDAKNRFTYPHGCVRACAYTRRVQKVKIQRSQTCTKFLIYKSDTVNELPVHNFILFKIVANIVQIFIKSWNQLLYPRVIEICCLSFEPRHDFFLHLIIFVGLFPSEMFLSSSHFADS